MFDELLKVPILPIKALPVTRAEATQSRCDSRIKQVKFGLRIFSRHLWNFEYRSAGNQPSCASTFHTHILTHTHTHTPIRSVFCTVRRFGGLHARALFMSEGESFSKFAYALRSISYGDECFTGLRIRSRGKCAYTSRIFASPPRHENGISFSLAGEYYS